MSKEALAKVVQRAISDAAFRRQLSTDPAGALRGFGLTADETAAIRTGDAGRLSALGVDQRMSKAFSVGGGAVGATRLSQSDLSTSNAAVLDDGGASARGNVIPTSPDSPISADTDAASADRVVKIHDNPPGIAAADTDGAAAARVTKIVDNPPTMGDADADLSSGSFRSGDDWAFTSRAATQDAGDFSGHAAKVHDVAPGIGGDVTRIDPSLSNELTTGFIDESEAYLTKVGYDTSGTLSRTAGGDASGTAAAIPGSPEEAAAALSGTGGTAGGSGSAYIDDGQGYGVGLNASEREHTWSGDDIAGPTSSSPSSDVSGTEVTDINQTP